MHQTPFQVVPIRKRSLLQRLFRQYPEENAVIELNNLLATTSIQSILYKDIESIERLNQVSLKEFNLNLEEFYAVLLNDSLQNRPLSQKAKSELDHLKNILELQDRQIEFLHYRIGEPIYRVTSREIIHNGHVSEKERGIMKQLEIDLKFSRSIAEKIWIEESNIFLDQYVKQILASGEYSPTTDKRLKDLAANLGVSLNISSADNEKLIQYRLYWQLQHSPLPAIQVQINLQGNEVCYAQVSNATWNETKAERIGGKSVQVMKIIDTGTFYLTNKRILLDGRDKNYTIRLDKILTVARQNGGISIDKETGKSPLVKLPVKADIIFIMLQRLVR